MESASFYIGPGDVDLSDHQGGSQHGQINYIEKDTLLALSATSCAAMLAFGNNAKHSAFSSA